MRRSSFSLSVPFAAITLAGCVTINIYFPAAAAERAADRIIDEVYQIKSDSTKPRADKPATQQ